MIVVSLSKERLFRLKWMNMSSRERYDYIRARAACSSNGVNNSKAPGQVGNQRYCCATSLHTLTNPGIKQEH
jgi:hypothetical protein